MIEASRNPIRNFLWPIYGAEHKKFLPLTCMIALILFNYTVLRNLKDVFIINETGGSGAIAFLKVWGVIPAALIFFLVYSKLSNILSRQNLFYVTVAVFLGYFSLFGLVLYPWNDALQPTASVAWLTAHLPESFKYLISLYQHWVFSIFYIMAELWGSAIAALLFWQFANSIVRVFEAKRFYAHFYLLANLATATAGYITMKFSKLGTAMNDFSISVNYMLSIVMVAGILTMLLYWYVDKKVIPDPELVDPKQSPVKKSKLKLSLWESTKYIFQSKYLALIAILVISYGISINLVEVAWKHQAHIVYPTKGEYGDFMGTVTMTIGLSTFFIILVGGWLIRKMGWLFAALATPVILGVTGVIFFGMVIFEKEMSPVTAMLAMTPALFAVVIGGIQNVVSKSTKYALFDPTKEMSYIPLDEESKVKGKAAVDVVGGRLGKAGGAVIQSTMLMFIPMSEIMPYSAFIIIGIIVVWIVAVVWLHRLFVQVGGKEVWDNKIGK